MSLLLSFVSWALRAVFPPRRSTFGASPVNERSVTHGTDWNAVYRDRYNYQRETVLQESLLAWRLNPLARRLVVLTRQYVTDSIEFTCPHEGTARFLRDLWGNPLNRIGQRLPEWCEELTLTGNLFAALTTDSDARITAYNTLAAKLLVEFNRKSELPLMLDSAVGRVIRSDVAETMENSTQSKPGSGCRSRSHRSGWPASAPRRSFCSTRGAMLDNLAIVAFDYRRNEVALKRHQKRLAQTEDELDLRRSASRY